MGNFERFAVAEFTRTQFVDLFRTRIRDHMNGVKDHPFEKNRKIYLTRLCECYLHAILPHYMQFRVVLLSNYAKLHCCALGSKIFRILRRPCYWTTVAFICDDTAWLCMKCAKDAVKHCKKVKKVNFIPARPPIDFIQGDILGPILTTKRALTFLIIIMNHFSKLVPTISRQRLPAYSTGNCFMIIWHSFYCTPEKILCSNRQEFAAMILQDVCCNGGVKKLFLGSSHNQSSEHVHQFNRIVSFSPFLRF